jgi:hypothetical protein
MPLYSILWLVECWLLPNILGREKAKLEKESESEMNILKIKEKKELPLAQKELNKLGKNQEEIDIRLPPK